MESTTRRTAAHGARVALLTVWAVALLVGCADSQAPVPAPSVAGADADDDVAASTPADDPTEDPTVDPTEVPTEAPVAEDAAGVTDLTDEANGIYFTNLGALTGDEAAAVNAADAYMHAHWRALQTTVVGPELSLTAAVDVVRTLTGRAADLAASGSHFGGTVTFSPALVSLDNGLAHVAICIDQSAATIVTGDSVATPGDVGAPPLAKASVLVRGSAGTWIIEAYSTEAAAAC